MKHIFIVGHPNGNESPACEEGVVVEHECADGFDFALMIVLSPGGFPPCLVYMSYTLLEAV